MSRSTGVGWSRLIHQLREIYENRQEGNLQGRHCLETYVMFRVSLKEHVYGKRVLDFITCHCLLTSKKLYEYTIAGLYT